jgi:hypothetical protein
MALMSHRLIKFEQRAANLPTPLKIQKITLPSRKFGNSAQP